MIRATLARPAYVPRYVYPRKEIKKIKFDTVEPAPKRTWAPRKAVVAKIPAPKVIEETTMEMMPVVGIWKTEATTDAAYMKPARWENWYSHAAMDPDVRAEGIAMQLNWRPRWMKSERLYY